MANPNLLLDASCLINLCASGCLSDLALVLPFQLCVIDYLKDREALWTWSVEDTKEKQKTLISPLLAPLIRNNYITLISLLPEETALFTLLAQEMDEGEAMTAAVAISRGFAMAVDDNKARQTIIGRAPGIELLTTPDLLWKWSQQGNIQTDQLRKVLISIQRGASYVPRQTHPRGNWWYRIANPGS